MTALSGSFDLGSALGSLLVGFTVERVSSAAGFHAAAAGALAGLTLFVLAERRAGGAGGFTRVAGGGMM